MNDIIENMEFFTEDMVEMIYYVLIPAVVFICFVEFVYPFIRREKIKNIGFRLGPTDSGGQNCQKVSGQVAIIPARNVQIDRIELEFQYGMYIHHRLHSEKIILLDNPIPAEKLQPLIFEFEACFPRNVGDLNNYANISDEVKSFQIKHPKPEPNELVTFPKAEAPTETIARKLFGGQMEQHRPEYGWRLVLKVFCGSSKLTKIYVIGDGYTVLVPNGRPFANTLF
ncbi:MAG: hypothetical protein ACI9BF_000228 [Candidatus Paceibacteria bacterium]